MPDEKKGWKLGDGSYTCKPPNYAKHKKLPPSDPKFHRLVVGIKACQASDPLPEVASPDFTGRYQDEDGAVMTVIINHAGTHVELWVAEIFSFVQGQRPRTVYRYGGDGTGDFYSLYRDKEFTEGAGSLQRSGSTLILDLAAAGWTSPVTLIPLTSGAQTASMSDAALAVLELAQDVNFELLGRHQHAPLCRQQIDGIKRVLTGKEMQAHLQTLFDIPDQARNGSSIFKAGKALNEFAAKNLRSFTFHPDDKAQILAYAYQAILSTGLTLTPAGGDPVERTAHDWLAMAILKCRDFANPPQTLGTLGGTRFLGIGVARDTFKYRFTMNLDGISGDAGVGVMAFRGIVTAQRIEPTKGPVNEYHAFLGGLSAGISGGIEVHMESEGFGTSDIEWQPKEFFGNFTQLDSSGGISLGVGARSGYTAWLLSGNELHPPMEVNWGVTKTHGISAGKEILGVAGGYLSKEKPLKTRKTKTDTLPSEQYDVSYNLAAQTHFPLGVAALTPEGWEIVRIFCANELAALRNPGSELIIVGMADRVDDELYNTHLSKSRAENVLQAIRDILGSGFKIPTKRIHVHGWGEFLAKLMQDEDGSKNPEMRRVHVLINGRVTASLRGAP